MKIKLSHEAGFLLRKKQLLIIILCLAAFFRLLRIDFPHAYVFDEVYHGFTAKEYAKGLKEAWDPWAKPPPGVAYEWTHPPLAKEIMASSIILSHTEDAWAYRLPGAILGVIAVYVLYLLGRDFFKSETVGLISAFVFSVDGLNFVQSRTGMNDIYLVTFFLISLLFFIRKRFFLSAIFLGMSLASKWTALYGIAFIFGFFAVKDLYLIYKRKLTRKVLINDIINVATYIVVVPVVYLLSYLPYFILGYNWDQFIELQKQMWWYHTNLRAHHDYSSPWWSWPLNLYPVWYNVEYKDNQIANIFATGNPILFYFGLIALITSLWSLVKKFSIPLLFAVAGYLAFLLPWALSPRIMFLYHYSPCIPFLSLALGYQMDKLYHHNDQRNLFWAGMALIFLGFLILYPFMTGILVPKPYLNFFFHTNVTKNPFGPL
jgi:dolichyl-phosphate-mannose-protein mannosyltransferase